MSSKPVIDKRKSGVYINGQLKPPGKIKVKPSDRVWVLIAAVNEGDTGLCRVRIVDVTHNTVLVQTTRTVKAGGILASSSQIAAANRKIRMYTYYWDGSKWVTYSTYGDWDLVVKAPKPYPKVVRDCTRVYINGEWRAPGQYQVKEGDQVIVSAKIVNTGDKGLCRILVYDEINKTEVASISGTIDTNQTLSLTKGFHISKNMNIVVHAQWYDGVRGTWITTDSYG